MEPCEAMGCYLGIMVRERKRGAARNRTGVDGFAIRCLTAWLRRLMSPCGRDDIRGKMQDQPAVKARLMHHLRPMAMLFRAPGATTLSLLALVLLCGCVSDPETDAPFSRLTTDVSLRADAHDVLVPGEVCTYGVAWGGILPVGRVEYRLGRIETEEGTFLVYEAITEPALAVEAFLQSAGTIRTLADPKTFLPVSTPWVAANKDPHTRTAWFDQENGVGISGKIASDFLQVREIRGKPMFDPIGAIFFGRVVALTPGDEMRALMVEGTSLNLMTVRHAGSAHVIFKGQRILCTKVSLRTDRLNDQGELAGGDPWNDLVAWVAEAPGRPIMRIAGKIRFGTISLKLAERTLPGDSGR